LSFSEHQQLGELLMVVVNTFNYCPLIGRLWYDKSNLPLRGSFSLSLVREWNLFTIVSKLSFKHQSFFLNEGKFGICHLLGNRQQATGNRQQATGNKQQATGNRQQATGNRQQATGNRQQATGNRQQATGNRQQATGNRQQATGKVEF